MNSPAINATGPVWKSNVSGVSSQQSSLKSAAMDTLKTLYQEQSRDMALFDVGVTALAPGLLKALSWNEPLTLARAAFSAVASWAIIHVSNRVSNWSALRQKKTAPKVTNSFSHGV